MENEKGYVIPNRYFLVTFTGDCGADIWINDGVKIKDSDEKIKHYNSKSVKVDDNGILTTNDPEAIYSIYNQPIIKRMFIDRKTGEVNELFVNNSEYSIKYAPIYKIKIEEHIAKIKAAVDNGDYKFTPKINRDIEIAKAKAESADIELEEIKISNKLREIKLEEDKAKIAEAEAKAEAKKKKL